ncbi:metal-binding protein [Flavobacterium jumunjinense]|nr:MULTISPECIES: metal-binding protein [Flavobacterium]
MIKHIDIDNAELHQKIKRKEIVFGGNLNLKIYGTLQCKSGKRMKTKNRVFFQNNRTSQKNWIQTLWTLFAGRL